MFSCIKNNNILFSSVNIPKRYPRCMYFSFVSRRMYSSASEQTKYISKRTLTIVGLTTITGYGIYWYFYPHNNYPRSVSKPLRNALWQERKFKDFETSIRFYMDALEECKRLEMNKLSNEYTGVEIKMAEMYEKLNNLSKANEIYLIILNRIYNTLSADSNAGQHNDNTIEQSIRENLIKKDLSILNKIISNQNLQNIKSNAIYNQQLDVIETHLKLAENEVCRKNPDLQKIMQNDGDPSLLVKGNIFSNKSNESERDLQISINQSRLKQFSHVLSTFKEEYFVIRDLYTETFLKKGNINQTVESKLVTIGWMVLTNMSQEQILLSQANLGSLLYMKAENIEAHILHMKEKCPEKTQLISEMERNRLFTINMATRYYENVIYNAKSGKDINSTQSMDGTISQAICLSIYGLGIINLHENRIPKAKRLLEESINLSKGIGFKELYKESMLEYTKLKKLLEV